MIQRVQSIYLLLAGIFSGGVMTFFTLWQRGGSGQNILDLFNEQTIIEKSVPVLFFTSALLSIITIFLFKNRKMQFVLGRINILINFLLLGLLIYLSQTLSGETTVSEKGIGMFIPVIVVVLLVLANKAIRKDENLVKSVNRLR